MGEKMVDKVMRISENPQQIRNIAICAHIDHGKTTFSDNLLAGAGMMSEELAGKARLTDFHADEQERGITIDTAAVSMVHTVEGKEFLINLLDTPGHVDFGGDVTRAMRAVDGAIVLCDAVEGIMPQTETVLRQALKERVKPILFINKVDRLIKELQLTPEAMQERFVKIITSLNALIRKIAEEEYGAKWQSQVQDGSVAFGSAFHNWALSIPFMKQKGVTFKEVIDAYLKNPSAEEWKTLQKRAPIHECVLEMVIKHLPNPKEAQEYRIPKIWRGETDSEQGKALTSCNPDGPMNFVITKIVIDPQAGEISAGRLFSGTMKKGLTVHNLNAKEETRIQQVFIFNGAKREIVDNVKAGNIIGIGGVKSMPGDTLSSIDGTGFEKISHIFEPVITKSVEAKRPSDLPKVIEVLRQVQKEDPTIKVEINEETGEHLMSGMGELHLEVIENRIKTEKGVDIVTSNPIVVYRETVTKPGPEFEGKSPNKHNKLYFKVEPLPSAITESIVKGEIPSGRVKKKNMELRDKFVECGMETKVADKVKDVFEGNVFLDLTRGIVYINEIIEMVLDMFEDVMKAGGLAREPCTKIMVSLMDCKLHEDAIHRGPAQMYPAVREGIRGAMNQAKPLLFEPVQTILFEAPEEYMGEISKLISNKRGQLLDMKQEGAMMIVTGKIPVAETLGMASELRSATGGRGVSSMVDQAFEKLPEEMQQKIIQQIRQRKGLTENQ
jgi:elongation factor 2